MKLTFILKKYNFIQIDDSMSFMQKEFEDNLVDYCQKIRHRNRHCEIDDDHDHDHNHDHNCDHYHYQLRRKLLRSCKSMTLLHFAAALGYSKLVGVLLDWKSDNSLPILKREINAFSQDDDGFTPLVSMHAIILKSRSRKEPISRITGCFFI